jgi:hypothetical protein
MGETAAQRHMTCSVYTSTIQTLLAMLVLCHVALNLNYVVGVSRSDLIFNFLPGGSTSCNFGHTEAY